MFRRPLSLHLPLLLAVSLPLAVTACGNDLSDGDFGGVDLRPFFGDSSSKAPPLRIETQTGFFDGTKVTYYDFGWSASVKGTTDDDRQALLGIGPKDKIPKVAPVNPMYFFFDNKGNPMFSAPVREAKTGNYTMAGGRDVRNPNPSENAIKTLAYPVRQRDQLKDPNRNSGDYQRPIIDVIFDRDQTETLQKYSGLWEFVKVKAPAGYQPDQIKSWETLETGINSGDFSIQTSRLSATTELLAINCPIVDSRSIVLPNVSAFIEANAPSVVPEKRRNPQPKVELWYRRKRIDCFLVNGWESLGKTIPKEGGNDQYVLYKSNEDTQRIGVLDTDLFVVGSGTAAKRQIVSPVGELYIPRISARSSYFYVPGSAISTGSLPRHDKTDPPGYRPIKWWWNLDVTDAGGPFSETSLTNPKANLSDVRNIDAAKLSPRDFREPKTMNFPITNTRIPCPGATPDNDPCTQFGLVCGLLQNQTDDSCGERRVRYGEACAPTVATCRDTIDSTQYDNKTGEITKRGDLVEEWFVNSNTPKTTQPNPLSTPAMPLPPVPYPAGIALNAEFEASVPEDWRKIRKDLFAQMGRAIVERAGTRTYSCLEDQITNSGACYLSCDGGKANRLQGLTVPQTIKRDDGAQLAVTLPLDSRCGGELMPGFRCKPVTNENEDKGGSWCLRDCNPSEGFEVTTKTCQIPTLTYISDTLVGHDIARQTTCQSIKQLDPADQSQVSLSFGACVRDPAFSPFAK